MILSLIPQWSAFFFLTRVFSPSHTIYLPASRKCSWLTWVTFANHSRINCMVCLLNCYWSQNYNVYPRHFLGARFAVESFETRQSRQLKRLLVSRESRAVPELCQYCGGFFFESQVEYNVLGTALWLFRASGV